MVNEAVGRGESRTWKLEPAESLLAKLPERLLASARLAALHTRHVLAQQVRTQGPLSTRLALAMTFL